MITSVINMNCDFVFCLSSRQPLMMSWLVTLFCIVIKSALVQINIDLSKSVIFP